MRPLIILTLICCFSSIVHAQTENTNYEQALADSLGADDYGMKSYILVILKTGTNAVDDKEKVSKLFRGHMENIGRLANLGKLIVAGPLGKNEKSYRGIFIFNVKTMEEAKELLETDPAIKAGLLDVELYEWYGSAALPAYLETHDKIFKVKP